MANNEIKFNINKFIEGNAEAGEHYLEKVPGTESTEVAPVKRKRGRPRKDSQATTTQPAQPPMPQSSMSYIQENIPYTSLYAESNQQLDESINALKVLGSQVVGELQTVRDSKTLRNKYGIINDLSMTATTIINSTISAIKEKNNTATQASRFELDRMKSLKSTANVEDDNTRIANMYDAFVNTPIGVGPSMLGPSMQDMMLPSNASGLDRMTMGTDATQAWEQNLSPAQNRMVLEAKGAIETVVVYDEVGGKRWYDVVDKVTRQSVPNVEKPDESTLWTLDINTRGMYAKDSNRGVVYPLVIVNGVDPTISEY